MVTVPERSRTPATRAWNVARGIVGVGFVVSAIGNLVFTVRDPDPIFEFFIDGVTVPVFADLMEDVIAPNPELFVVLTVIFEAAVGIMVLGRGRWVDVGLIGILGFLLFLFPYNQPMVPYGLSTLMLVALVAPLLTRSYHTALWTAIGIRLRHPDAGQDSLRSE